VKVVRSALRIPLALGERAGVRETVMAAATYIRGGADAMAVRPTPATRPRMASTSGMFQLCGRLMCVSAGHAVDGSLVGPRRLRGRRPPRRAPDPSESLQVSDGADRCSRGSPEALRRRSRRLIRFFLFSVRKGGRLKWGRYTRSSGCFFACCAESANLNEVMLRRLSQGSDWHGLGENGNSRRLL
jgi:hypothetical protein